MLRLSLLLFLWFNMVGAMTLEDMNGDVPPNFAEIMPKEYVEFAVLGSERNFDGVIEYLVRLNEKNRGYAEEFSSKLKEVYSASKKEYTEKRDFLDSSLTEKGFMYNQFLRYFWWSHYYPVYEGLI